MLIHWKPVLLACSISLLFLCTAMPVEARDGDDARAAVYGHDPAALLHMLDRNGFDVVGKNGPAGYVEIIASFPERIVLERLGYRVEVIESYGDRKSRALPPGYHDPAAVGTLLTIAQTNYPQIAKLIHAGTTFEDRPVYVMKISDNVAADEDEPNIMIVSNHHAREITTVEYGLWVVEKLTTLYGTDPDVTRWVDQNQIYVAPNWNPDGLDYCFTTDEWWRKNRSPQGTGYFGVDQNRNYDLGWYGPHGGSTSPSSLTYKGPFPVSEMETQAMVNLAQERQFAKIVDFHSSGSEVLYTYYSDTSFPQPIEDWYETKAIEFSYALNYAGDYRKPSAEGEHYQWELAATGGLSFLVETGYEFQPDFTEAESEFADHIWPGVQWFLEETIPLHGHVKEAGTGLPLEAEISVAGISYSMGEIRKSDPTFGAFHYYLPEGTYDVTFTAAGYAPRTESVTIDSRDPTLLEVQLGPEPQLTVNGMAVQGEVVELDFDWPAGPGQAYVNGASFSDQGFTFPNGVHVPVSWDSLYNMTCFGKVPGWLGYFDGAGHGSALLPIPHDPNVAGLTIYMAYFTWDLSLNGATNASAAVKILIQ